MFTGGSGVVIEFPVQLESGAGVTASVLQMGVSAGTFLPGSRGNLPRIQGLFATSTGPCIDLSSISFVGLCLMSAYPLGRRCSDNLLP